MLMRSIAYDERLVQLTVASEYLFLKAIPHQDECGRMFGEPAYIRGTVVPTRAVAEGWTDEIVRSLMVEWIQTKDEYSQARPLVLWGYGASGVLVIQFPGFAKTQKLRRKGSSSLPEPVVPVAEFPSEPTLFDDARLSWKRREEKRSEEKEVAAYAAGANGAQSDDVNAVYDHWRQERARSHSRYNTISDARRKKVSARLREFTVDDLKRAISAVALDPWEDRPRHDDLTVILRSREQVERFLALAETGPSPRPSRRGGLRPQEILALPEAAL
jgi:hypothetical protein